MDEPTPQSIFDAEPQKKVKDFLTTWSDELEPKLLGLGYQVESVDDLVNLLSDDEKVSLVVTSFQVSRGSPHAQLMFGYYVGAMFDLGVDASSELLVGIYRSIPEENDDINQALMAVASRTHGRVFGELFDEENIEPGVGDAVKLKRLREEVVTQVDLGGEQVSDYTKLPDGLTDLDVYVGMQELAGKVGLGEVKSLKEFVYISEYLGLVGDKSRKGAKDHLGRKWFEGQIDSLGEKE